MKKFKCNFGLGVTCEVQMANEPPRPDGSHVLKTVWEGEMSRRILRPYIAWMNGVNKQMADEWGVSFAHAFLISASEFEVWTYRPGKQPKRITMEEMKK